MTKDEDKQRSVLILSASDIAAFQQVLFQKQYKGGVDLCRGKRIRETGIKEKQLLYITMRRKAS